MLLETESRPMTTPSLTAKTKTWNLEPRNHGRDFFSLLGSRALKDLMQLCPSMAEFKISPRPS